MGGQAERKGSKKSSELTFGGVNPVRPDELVPANERQIPDVVFDVFNAHLTRGSAKASTGIRIEEEDIVRELVKRGLKKADIFGKKWLQVEPIYRQAGWEVVYSRPNLAYEYFPSSLTFKAPVRWE